MALRRFILAVAGFAAFLVSPVVAQVTAPTYSTATGNTLNAQGVVILNPDGSAATSGGTGTSASQVQGNAASGAADTGNPVKVGGVYNSTLSPLTDGQRGNLMQGSRGSLNVTLMQADSVNPLANVGDNSDAQTTGSTARLLTVSRNYVWNGSTWDRAPGSTAGANVVSKGGASLNTGQVSVTTSSTLVAAARTGRNKITMSVGAANTCAFGNTGVTTTTGFPLAPTVGASLTLDTAAAIYAVCSATTTISFIEQY
ncbi:hypothetical protein [Sphingobium sp. WCS2017Hpa-17]|uniref:hypothetical protein n=1 Tax=Sphingobium sp. WCS2017Hpa-17 TaxID=3073638 RepID=UPI00288B968E|nr:hypothetical protein [Sphingobium sp. WCS2017Hpa-17]